MVQHGFGRADLKGKLIKLPNRAGLVPDDDGEVQQLRLSAWHQHSQQVAGAARRIGTTN